MDTAMIEPTKTTHNVRASLEQKYLRASTVIMPIRE